MLLKRGGGAAAQRPLHRDPLGEGGRAHRDPLGEGHHAP